MKLLHSFSLLAMLSFASTSAFGQTSVKDLSSLRLSKYSIEQCWKEGLWREAADTGDDPRDADPGTEVTASFPRIIPRSKDAFIRQTADSLSRYLLLDWDLDTKRRLLIRSKINNPHTVDTNATDEEMPSEPFTLDMDFDAYGTDAILSIQLYAYEMACCGASGSQYHWRGFNVDLHNRSFLTLSDIIEPSQVAAFEKYVQRDLLNGIDTNTIDPDDPPHFEWDPKNSAGFSVTDSSLNLFVYHGLGGHSWDDWVVVPYTKPFFKAEFLRNIRRGKRLVTSGSKNKHS